MRLFMLGVVIGLMFGWLVDVNAGPGAALAIGAGIVSQSTSSNRHTPRCVNGRTSKIPVLESYAWDGTRRNYGYEWIVVCERWETR